MGLSVPQAAAPVSTSGSEWNVESLADAFRREAKLLLDLQDVLQRQRNAVAKDDLPVVDETVYSAQRIFRTLAEARRQRRAILEILGLDREASVDALEELLGSRMTVDLGLARSELQEAARRVSRELSVNRKILQGAIATGEDLIQGLRGASAKGAGVYGPGSGTGAPKGDGGFIINRQI